METERFNEHIVYNRHCPLWYITKLAPYFSGAILAKPTRRPRGQWNEEDGMLAQGREAKVTRFLLGPRCETSRGRKHRLVFDTTMEDFWLLEYICCSRNSSWYFESDSGMIWNLLVQISLRGDEKENEEQVRQWNYIVVNHSHWDGESSRWINWLIRVLSLSSTVYKYIYVPCMINL